MAQCLADRARLSPPRGRCENSELPAASEAIAAMRGLRGELARTRREGMPSGAEDASLLSSTLPNSKAE
eukprot:2018810-Pyramimonas_sp.AAC.1